MKSYIKLFVLILGIFMISFGVNGSEWYHWGSYTSGIVTVIIAFFK